MGRKKVSNPAKEMHAEDVALAARFDELLADARAAENALRKMQAATAPNDKLYPLARKLDAALTNVMRAAYAAERAEIGPRGYDDPIYRRKAKAKPAVHAWTDEAERLLTLRETHRLTGIPPRSGLYQPDPPERIKKKPPPTGGANPGSGMIEWRTTPKLDSGSGAGFQLIVVGYGVILITVFPANLADLRSHGIPGLLHLLLAAAMIVVSWMGYYSNRQRYPVWRGQFFNIPLLQYLLSFVILFLYWGLGITALPSSPHASKARAPVLPSPFDEAVIIFAVFALYWVWDTLEIRVQEDRRYTAVLKAKQDQQGEQGEQLPPPRTDYRRRFRHRNLRGRSSYFAKNIRAGRAMTAAFTGCYLIILIVVLSGHIRGVVPVGMLDIFYIASLFLYRFMQRIWPGIWYERA